MKIGLIGAGFMSRTHLAGWRAIGEDVAGILAFDDPSVTSLATKENLDVFKSVSAMAATCDVIDVCSPTFTHREYVIAAAATGKAVFCEKPLALNVRDGVEMVRAAENAGVALGVGHVLRYFPEYASAARTMQSGVLGDPAVLRFSRCTFAPRNGWYLDESRSGGVILDLMIHDLDYARYLAGEVTRVYAIVDRGAAADTGVPGPHAYVILTHASGAITHAEGSWRMPQPEFLTSFEIAGSRALLTFDSSQCGAVVPHIAAIAAGTNAPDVPVATSPVSEDPYAAQLRAFRDALVAGDDPPVDGREGLAALQIALAAGESSRTGNPVDISPVEV